MGKYLYFITIVLLLLGCEKDEQIKKNNTTRKFDYFKGKIDGKEFYIDEGTSFYHVGNGNQGGSSSTSEIEYKAFGLSYTLSQNQKTWINIYFAKSYYKSILTDTMVHHGGKYIFKDDGEFHNIFKIGPQVYFYSKHTTFIPELIYNGVYVRLYYNNQIWESFYSVNGLTYSNASINNFTVLDYKVINQSYNPDGDIPMRKGKVIAEFNCKLYSKSTGETLEIHNAEFKGNFSE